MGQAHRKPFLVAALVLMAVVVGLEVGSSWLDRPPVKASVYAQVFADEGLDADERKEALKQIAAQALQPPEPPGIAIPALALVDGLMLLSMAGLVASLFVPHTVTGRVIPIVNLVVGVLVVVAGIATLLAALALLAVMVGLFLAPPFGTIAYLAKWAAFPRGSATTLLGIALVCRLGFFGFALAASPRLLKQKAFMAMAITGLLLQLMVGLMHGLVPLPVVSIIDAVAALIVAIVAIVWAAIVAVGSLVGTVRALRPART